MLVFLVSSDAALTSHPSVLSLGMDTMLGIVSPTAEETGGYAVAGVWIFGRHRGLIASAAHEPDSGRLIRLAELMYR